MKSLYNSRWWATLVGLLLPLANHIFGLGIPTEEIVGATGVIAAFVLGESYRKSKLLPPTPPVPPGTSPAPHP